MKYQTKNGICCGIAFSAAIVGAGILAEDPAKKHKQDINAEVKSYEHSTDLPESLPLLSYDLPIAIEPVNLAINSENEINIDDILEAKPWRIDTENTLIEFPEYLQNTDYETLELSEAMQTEIVVGDRVSLPMQNGEFVDVEITADSMNESGDYTWEGNVVDNGNEYPVIVTQGRHGTFGSIATADGTFTLTTISGQGILYKNPEISGPRGRDYLVPDFHG